jgi:hypothetical protein
MAAVDHHHYVQQRLVLPKAYHRLVASQQNLKNKIIAHSAKVQMKAFALAALNHQLITRLPFLFFLNQGVHIFQYTKGINPLLAQDWSEK